jgi:nitrate reductase gamma subunit
MPFVQYLTYGGLAIAFIAMLIKALRYATAPESMRWELYPVPHEKGRADYGGSYLEELDWWTKPRRTDFFRELKEMAEEILLLKGVYHHNKKVWAFSFPFHFGLYLSIGWLLLLLVGAVLDLAGLAISPSGNILGAVIYYLTPIVGYAGLILAGFGALGLFFWRAGDKRQRSFNSPIEYFNLLFFVAVIVITLIYQLGRDPSFAGLREYVMALVQFSPAAVSGTLFGIEIALISLLIMYIPLTRMSHFVAKYFLYHMVRWNDEPNFRGSKIEKRLLTLLNRKVGWAGPHIQQGETWATVVKESKK